jgi:predicted Zn-dependent peptidase
VLVSLLSEETVEKEREIIAREIRLYQDNYESVGELGALKMLYGSQPLGTDIAGSKETIQEITLDILAQAHTSYYRPPNMALFIGGDLDAARLWDQMSQWQELNAFSQQEYIKPKILQRSAINSGAVFERSMAIALPRLYLGFQDRKVGLSGQALLARELALDLALDMLFSPSSDFFQRSYQTGLIEAETFEWDVQLEQAYAYVLISGDSPQPKRLKAEILDELAKARKSSLIEEAFKRTKRKAYGHMIERFEQVESGVEMMHQCAINGATPFDLYAVTKEINIDNVYDCLHTCLEPEYCVTSIIWPE